MKGEIRKYKFRQSAKLKIEVVPLKTLTTSNRPHLVTPHRTDFHHVFMFEDCSPTHLVDFNPIKIKPYTLLFIDKDRVHQQEQFALCWINLAMMQGHGRNMAFRIVKR